MYAKFGIEVPLDKIRSGVASADRYYFKENAKSPIDKRSPEEQAAVNIHYQDIILKGAGVAVSQEQLLKMLKYTSIHQ